MVLDNVCEREVVDVLHGVGVHLLVTTRDGSVVARQSGQTEVRNMTDDEMLGFLVRANGKTVSLSGPELQRAMLKVIMLVSSKYNRIAKK